MNNLLVGAEGASLFLMGNDADIEANLGASSLFMCGAGDHIATNKSSLGLKYWLYGYKAKWSTKYKS